MKSIESDLLNGAKEIWLTSQDNASYGLDRRNPELTDLLKNILSLNHRFKLRLGMMDPNNIPSILKELIEIYKSKKMFKFAHIPIQSASNKVLKHMNRQYSIEDAEKIMSELQKNIPEITLATDIIVGYPTETEEDHKLNLDFIRKFKPDILNLSKFSSHKETEAGKLKILPNSIISRRTKEIMEAHRQTASENKHKYLGKVMKVFVNKKISGDLHQARSENYCIVLLKCQKEMLGEWIEAKIIGAGVHHLIGESI